MKDKKKSKRVGLKQKYSVESNVREHNRRMKKTLNSKEIQKRFKRKDPGIPNSWPFKADMLRDIQKRREENAAEKQRLRQEQREQRKSQNDTPMEDVEEYEELLKNAEAANADFSESTTSDSPAARDVNSTSGFFKVLRQVIRDSDVVIEVLDARNPQSCRNVELERQIVAEGKKLVLLLNKIDLVPKEVVEKWIVYLRRSFPTVAFKAALTSKSSKPIIHAKVDHTVISESELRVGSQVVGAPALTQLLKNYSRSGPTNAKTSISVGVIGVPNVGKSSVINSLCRNASAARVGGEAGVTRKSQEIFLDSKVKLVDSPGVIMNESETDVDVILRNAVKISMVSNPIEIVDGLLKKYSTDQIMKLFQVCFYNDTSEFLGHIARARGKLVKGGGLDFAAAAQLVLVEWTSGKIRHFCLPPAKDAVQKDAEDAGLVSGPRFVSQFSEAFDIDALLKK